MRKKSLCIKFGLLLFCFLLWKSIALLNEKNSPTKLEMRTKLERREKETQTNNCEKAHKAYDLLE